MGFNALGELRDVQVVFICTVISKKCDFSRYIFAKDLFSFI